MVGIFARGVGAVVATGAIGGHGKGAVIGLGTGPGSGRFVTGLATGRSREVVTALARGAGAVVAAGASRHYRDIGVQLGRCPGREALMAGATGRGGRQVSGRLARGF